MTKTWMKRTMLGVLAAVVASSSFTPLYSAEAAAPYDLTRSGKVVTIDWADAENADRYMVTPVVNGVEKPAETVDDSKFVDAGTLPNHDYRYKVEAVTVATPPIDPPVEETDKEEEVVPEDEGESTIPDEEPETPAEPEEVTELLFTTNVVRYGFLTKLKASAKLATYNSVSLSYTNIYGATGYEVFRSTKKTSGFKKVATTTKTQHTDKKLALGTTYYYKVRGVQTTNKGTFYTNDSSTLSKRTVLGKTALKVSKTTYRSVILSWKKADGATKYKVYRSTKKTKGFKHIKTVSGTSYTNTSLKTGTRYYYKVVPYRGATKGATTKTVSAKPSLGKTKITRLTMSLGTAKLSWDKVSGASGYKLYRATSKSGKYKHVKTTKSRSHTDKKLGNNKTYYYKVKAYRNVTKKKQVSGSYSSAFKVVTPRKADQYRLKEGLYILETNGLGYYEVCRYTVCDWSTDENDIFENKAYVYVPAGWYLTFEPWGSSGHITEAEYYYASQKSSFSKAGYYLVGFDLRPGTYRVSGSQWWAYRKCYTMYCDWGNGYDVIDLLTDGGTRYVTLQKGDFFILDGNAKGTRQ